MPSSVLQRMTSYARQNSLRTTNSTLGGRSKSQGTTSPSSARIFGSSWRHLCYYRYHRFASLLTSFQSSTRAEMTLSHYHQVAFVQSQHPAPSSLVSSRRSNTYCRTTNALLSGFPPNHPHPPAAHREGIRQHPTSSLLFSPYPLNQGHHHHHVDGADSLLRQPSHQSIFRNRHSQHLGMARRQSNNPPPPKDYSLEEQLYNMLFTSSNQSASCYAVGLALAIVAVLPAGKGVVAVVVYAILSLLARQPMFLDDDDDLEDEEPDDNISSRPPLYLLAFIGALVSAGIMPAVGNPSSSLSLISSYVAPVSVCLVMTLYFLLPADQGGKADGDADGLDSDEHSPSLLDSTSGKRCSS
jgi:hypothetical protein